MILGIGTDVVEVERIAQKLTSRPGFVEMVFSEKEIAYCKKQTHTAESFAARFAAKEAFLKALGTGMEATFELSQIEVLNYENGKPYMVISDNLTKILHEKGIGKSFVIHISLSHTKQMATAVVVLEVS
jgi:holo-[acyl-carrier protein] synthase